MPRPQEELNDPDADPDLEAAIDDSWGDPNSRVVVGARVRLTWVALESRESAVYAFARRLAIRPTAQQRTSRGRHRILATPIINIMSFRGKRSRWTRSSPLQDLLREDADRDLSLHDITARATDAAEELSTFEQSFADAPGDVPVSLLQPTMSAAAPPRTGTPSEL